MCSPCLGFFQRQIQNDRLLLHFHISTVQCERGLSCRAAMLHSIIVVVSLILFLPFRNRIRMYPAFVNCTTIDWFSEWPQDALLEVAEKYVENMDLGDDEVMYNVP